MSEHNADNDVCECGDYRRQHADGRGRCRVCQPWVGPPNAPWNGCLRFRLHRVIPSAKTRGGDS